MRAIVELLKSLLKICIIGSVTLLFYGIEWMKCLIFIAKIHWDTLDTVGRLNN